MISHQTHLCTPPSLFRSAAYAVDGHRHHGRGWDNSSSDSSSDTEGFPPIRPKRKGPAAAAHKSKQEKGAKEAYWGKGGAADLHDPFPTHPAFAKHAFNNWGGAPPPPYSPRSPPLLTYPAPALISSNHQLPPSSPHDPPFPVSPYHTPDHPFFHPHSPRTPMQRPPSMHHSPYNPSYADKHPAPALTSSKQQLPPHHRRFFNSLSLPPLYSQMPPSPTTPRTNGPSGAYARQFSHIDRHASPSLRAPHPLSHYPHTSANPFSAAAPPLHSTKPSSRSYTNPMYEMEGTGHARGGE